MYITLILFIVLIVILRAYFSSSKVKGRIGESRVVRRIDSLFHVSDEYYPFHNVLLESLDGTTQIDHILVSPYGVFVNAGSQFWGCASYPKCKAVRSI